MSNVIFNSVNDDTEILLLQNNSNAQVSSNCILFTTV